MVSWNEIKEAKAKGLDVPSFFIKEVWGILGEDFKTELQKKTMLLDG